MTPHDDTLFDAWIASLEARHVADLTFPEISRALRALSSAYVERRQRLVQGEALAGAGKRAAFALFYGPLHYLLVRAIVGALPRALVPRSGTLVNLGSGSGAAGAAWALRTHAPILAIDRHPWALAEAAWTCRQFRLKARTVQADLVAARLPRAPCDVIAAFALNELRDRPRDDLLARLVERARLGDRLLVVEPLAGFVAPWWSRWRDTIVDAGGRADEWRFRVELPPFVAKLDRAAGLNHRELSGRSLFLAGGDAGPAS